MASSVLPAHLAAGPRAADTGATVVLADGEHYPQVVSDAIVALKAAGWRIEGVALVGGSEKLRSDPDYGVPHVSGETPVDALLRAGRECGATSVIDLADEPVLVLERRLDVIAAAAAAGIDWYGADGCVLAPRLTAVGAPSIAIVGTGKRIGKTAISAHLARLADVRAGGHGSVIVVAMGRGGPRDPVVVDRTAGPVTVDRLIEISRSGMHAASDYLEDAALTGLTTIGCRRGGGGFVGSPVVSNVAAGADLAVSRSPSLIVFEGSGSCVPPVAVDRTLLIASTARPCDLLEDFGRYRRSRADAVLIVGDDAEVASAMADRVRQLDPERPDLPVVGVQLRPHPMEPVDGRRIAVFTTAPVAAGQVFARRLSAQGGEVALVSHALSRRDELRRDVDAALAAGVDAFVVEIKAAAIDVVAERASEAGVDVILLDNRPEAHDPTVDLDAVLADLSDPTGFDQ